jgi:hypothetical protein
MGLLLRRCHLRAAVGMSGEAACAMVATHRHKDLGHKDLRLKISAKGSRHGQLAPQGQRVSDSVGRQGVKQ